MAVKLTNFEDKSKELDNTSPRGTFHMSQNTNLYEPQRTNNFEFIIDRSLDNAYIGYSIEDQPENDKLKLFNSQEVIRMSVVRASVPHFTQGVVEVRRGNSVLKYAGVPTFDAGSLEINDYIGADGKSVLMAWQSLSYNVITEKVGLASEYKKDCYLVEYSPDYQIVRQWILHGCWVSGLSESDFNNETNDKKTITATIQFDRAELDLSDQTTDEINALRDSEYR